MSYKELPSGKYSSESSLCRAGCEQCLRAGGHAEGTWHPRVLRKARAEWEVLRGNLWSCRPSQAKEGALGAGIMGYQLPMLTVWAWPLHPVFAGSDILRLRTNSAHNRTQCLPAIIGNTVQVPMISLVSSYQETP